MVRYTFDEVSVKYLELFDVFAVIPLFFNLDSMSVSRFLFHIQDCSFKTQIKIINKYYTTIDKQDEDRVNAFYNAIIRL